MKVFVRKNNVAKLGYELVIKSDDGNEQILEITSTDPANDQILKLPENPSNRKWLSIKKIGEQLELEYKETKVFGPRSEQTPRKGIEDWLNDEDKKLYKQLIEKAKKNREEATKRQPKTEKQRLLEKIARLQKMYEELGE